MTAGTGSVGKSEGPLKYVCFCHNESFPNCEGSEGLSTPFKWSAGYYKKLRFWNGTIYPLNINMIIDYTVYDNL